MQEKKFDKNQLIGFVLMLAIFAGYWFLTKPTEEEIEKAKQEQLAKEQEEAKANSAVKNTDIAVVDSLSPNSNVAQQTFTLENDKMLLEFSNLGAQLSKVQLKEYQAYDKASSNHEKPLYLINNNNANFALKINDKQGRTLDLSKRAFQATQNGNSITFTTQENGGTIQYKYTLTGDYDLAFDIASKGLSNISTDNKAELSFDMKAISQEKGKSWEQRVTDIHYRVNGDQDYTSSSFETEGDESMDWVGFKQQFFTSILENENGIKNAKINVETPENDSIYSKYFTFSAPLKINGEINQNFTWHFLPLEYNLTENYGKDFQEIIPFGFFKLFRWINVYLMLPVFKFMASWGIQLGWVIALMTIFVKLITSPIMYKQYRQSAMMRVLKPDMEKLSEKYPNKEDAMKKQQEVMGMYRTAGVNPLAGCLPALLQIPIFYSLFNFFPNVIDLRGKSFLWADDLTAFDSIFNFGFDIPFYGDHVSLFALLYVVTMVIYFRVSGNMMQQPTQEGMPDMRIIMYIMPVMFIFFLNSYASGLSWYYFVSNAINIGLVFVIKNWLIDDDKIHAKIQANKAKPQKKKKKSGWSKRLEDAMKQAQAQQEAQKRNKK